MTNCNTLNIGKNANVGVPFVNCAIPNTTAIVTGTGGLTFAETHIAAGVYRPGLSPGTLTINPAISALSTAVFDMEIIGGYGAAGTADDADQLASDGNITLNGTLHLIFNNPDIGSYQ